MTRKDYAVLFLLSLIVITAAGYLQKSAGYMDAEYYAVTGRGLLSGKGFTQDFLWNYLDDPRGPTCRARRWPNTRSHRAA